MKNRRYIWLLITLLTGMLMLTQRIRANDITTEKTVAEKAEAGLRDSIVTTGEGTYIVVLKTQADLSQAYAIDDWNARGQYVYDTLRTTAQTSQASLVKYLSRQLDRGNVSSYQPHFIINAILVTSDVSVFDTIAARPDVAALREARTYQIPEPEVTLDVAPQAIEWGVDRIGAPSIWADFGTTGAGVVIANIDTGVDYDHPALVNQYRGTLTGSHNFNFYDPANVCGGTVCDNNNHGSHTMGTMVGDDGGSNQIGVAPGATWIAAKGCESSSCSTASLLSSAEWVLAPCAFGDNPGDPSCDPGMRPNIVSNSWGGGGGDPWYQSSVDAWHASGIIPVFSAGNSGPGAGTMGSPGDYCNVVGVGATDISDNIASFSSRGPGNFANCQDKPDVSAPGANVRSSINGGGYANFSGTSMAAPHVAGCIALLKSIEPALNYTDVYDLLTNTADDLGTPGFDFNFGYGRINCYEAALNLTPDFRLSATPASTDVCATGNTVTNFDIDVLSVAGFTDPVTLSNDAGGSFSVNPVPPPGTSVLTVDAAGYPAPGVLNVIVTGTSTTGSKSTQVAINLFAGRPDAATLLAPADGEVGVSTSPTFTWAPGAQASSYEFALATAPDRDSIVYYVSGLTDTSFTLPAGAALDPLTTYYWVVRTNNPCGRRISAISSFTTRAQVCSTPGLAIPDSNTTGVSDSITFSPSGNLTDLDVSIDTTHTWVGDLRFTLTHNDSGTSVVLYDRPGVPGSSFGCSGDNIDATINDEGVDGNVETMCGNNPATSGDVVGGDPPNTSLLSAFDGEAFGGTWTLTVTDNAGGDVGTLNEWCLIGGTN